MDASSLRHALAAGKVGVPAAHARHIVRKHLVTRIGNLPPGSVALVRAPAGFGKTTLLGQCATHVEAAGARVAWLTLDRADNDLARFLHVLAASLYAAAVMENPVYARAPVRSAGTPLGFDADRSRISRTLANGSHEDLSHASQSADDTLALTILDALLRHAAPVVLIFDEMETIDDPAVLDFINHLLFALAPAARVLIGARHVPGLAWHRLRMAGRLVELDAGVMAFSMQETTQFLNQDGVTPLTPSDMETLHGKTEGWVAALWLASLSLAGNDGASAFVATFSGDDRAVAQCLSHDVFDRQTPQAQRFLLVTSILRRIDAALCQVLLPDLPCKAIIDVLAAADIVLRTVSGDARSYRYHSMFATYLQARLRATYPDEVTLLHRQAAAWYEGQGRAVPAIDHAIDAGDFDFAARLLARHGAMLLEQGRLRLLARWFAQIPPHVMSHWADLRAIRIWAILFSRGPSDAMYELDLLGTEGDLGEHVHTHMLALRPLLLSMLDRHEQAFEIGLPALKRLGDMSASDSFAQTALTNAMANVAGALGRYPQARALLDRARSSQSGQSFFNTMYSETVEGTIDLQAGRFAQAAARFRLAVGATRVGTYGRANGNAWAGVLHAACVYEAGDVENASRLLDVYVPLGRDVGLPDHLILGYLMQSRIAARVQSIEQTFVLLGELEYLGHHRRLPRIAASARLERARVLLLQGHVQAAADELRRADDADLWLSMANLRLAANDFLYPTLARLRWEAYAGNAQQAADALAHERDIAHKQGRVRRTWKLDLLGSVALARAGDSVQADQMLAGVLSPACEEGLHGCIVDEGSAMAMRLFDFSQGEIGRRWLAVSQRRMAFEQWQGGLEGSPEKSESDVTPASTNVLTRKEMGVLTLLAEGLSNTEIAGRLFVSDSTVRTHLRNLNVKLSATSRTQAVAMARRAGLIG